MLKVLGIGDNVVDRFLDRGIMYPGGQAMNVAVYCRKIGSDSAYFGAFGTDDMGRLNRRVLKELGVRTERCLVLEGENAFARVRTVNGERIFVNSNKGGVAKGRPWAFSKEDLDYITSFDVLHTDQNSNIERDLPALRQLGPVVSFDFSWKLDSEYLRLVGPWCDVAFLSCSEMAEGNAIQKMNEVMALGPAVVVATRGSEGSLALWQGRVLHQSVVQTEVVDTMGAGDSFAAGFLMALLSGTHSGRAALEATTQQRVIQALTAGATLAAEICALEGAFDHGVPFALTDGEKALLEQR